LCVIFFNNNWGNSTHSSSIFIDSVEYTLNFVACRQIQCSIKVQSDYSAWIYLIFIHIGRLVHLFWPKLFVWEPTCVFSSFFCVNVHNYLHISCKHSCLLQDCGMQLTDEPDKRCYPLDGRLMCRACHIQRLSHHPRQLQVQWPYWISQSFIYFWLPLQTDWFFLVKSYSY